MGTRKLTFLLGENAHQLEEPLRIERNTTYVLDILVNLPDQGLGMVSSKAVDAVIGHIRQNINDVEPELVFGNTGGRLYTTVTRPSASQVRIKVKLPRTVTRDLDLAPPRRVGSPQRYDQPGQGFIGIKWIDDDADHWGIVEGEVRTKYLVVREDQE